MDLAMVKILIEQSLMVGTWGINGELQKVKYTEHTKSPTSTSAIKPQSLVVFFFYFIYQHNINKTEHKVH